jgi:CheY-like chemotaxis protein
VKGNAELEQFIAAAQKGGARGRQLTAQLLAFARRQTLHPEIRSINELVGEFDALASRILGEMVEIELNLDPHCGATHVDPAQFGSALLNLVVNSRDAMPRGGKVTIGTESVTLDRRAAARRGPDAMPGSYVMVRVVDTGSGMSPETLAHALEPFFTTKEAGKGTGLGLSQVYGFVRQSGGFLSLDSTPGKGTEVCIYLPTSAEAPQGTIANAVANKSPSGTETVLLVEDDEDVRNVMISSLTDLGYRVLVARNAPEALKVLEEQALIDLVVTDVVMPGGMTGIELVREVRQRRPPVRALLISGYTANNELISAKQGAGDLPLLGKPFRQPELARAIRAALARGHAKTAGRPR